MYTTKFKFKYVDTIFDNIYSGEAEADETGVTILECFCNGKEVFLYSKEFNTGLRHEIIMAAEMQANDPQPCVVFGDVLYENSAFHIETECSIPDPLPAKIRTIRKVKDSTYIVHAACSQGEAATILQNTLR